jgi:MFS family permease
MAAYLGKSMLLRRLKDSQTAGLIIATSGVQLAIGFFGSFLSLRIAGEGLSPTMAGLVLSSYFAGYTVGALRCAPLVGRIGHIRSYAAFVGMVVAATAAMPLFVGAWPWASLRVIVGFGCAGIFVTTESWLNAKAEPLERGRIFSHYMLGIFIALALGQLLIIGERVETAAPFSSISVLFALSLIIVSTRRATLNERRSESGGGTTPSRRARCSCRFRIERFHLGCLLCARSSMDAGCRH